MNNGREPVDNRRQIFRAATQEFAEKGYARAVMLRIAEAADTSVGLLYYHYGSKERLYYAIWKEYQREQERRLREAIAAAQEEQLDGPELLLVGARAYLHGAWEDRYVYRMAHHMDTPGFAKESQLVSNRWMSRSTMFVEGADPLLTRVVVAVFTSGLGGACSEVVRFDTRPEADEFIDRSVTILRGIVHAYENVQREARAQDTASRSRWSQPGHVRGAKRDLRISACIPSSTCATAGVSSSASASSGDTLRDARPAGH